MLDLNFQVEKAAPERAAAAPTLLFSVRVSEAVAPGVPATTIQSVLLRCQVQIEPARRRYAAKEQDQLVDLFGTPERWGKTVHPLLWAHAQALVPPFTHSCKVNLPVPCGYDFSAAANKYFYAIEEGEIPLRFLFSGTIFYQADNAGLQVAQIPWEKEATFRLPIDTWKQLMDLYYPNIAWLALHKDIFDRLYQYKSQHGLATWDQTLEELLSGVEERVAP